MITFQSTVSLKTLPLQILSIMRQLIPYADNQDSGLQTCGGLEQFSISYFFNLSSSDSLYFSITIQICLFPNHNKSAISINVNIIFVNVIKSTNGLKSRKYSDLHTESKCSFCQNVERRAVTRSNEVMPLTCEL